MLIRLILLHLKSFAESHKKVSLGPSFLCYVNDMPISVDCKLLLHAVDSALLVSNKYPKIVADKLSYELESCRQWLIDNKLSLHLGKTEVILFGSKRKLNSVKDFSVICDGKKTNKASSVKYLGVTLDNTLSGNSIALNVTRIKLFGLFWAWGRVPILARKSWAWLEWYHARTGLCN